MEWVIQPPIELRLFRDGVLVNHAAQEGILLDLSEFVESYPWALEELVPYSRLVTYSLSFIKLNALDTTDLRQGSVPTGDFRAPPRVQ